VGMDTTRVVELLGEPDLTALKIDRGNLFETYVYKKKPGQDLAFIRLEGRPGFASAIIVQSSQSGFG
jgi:hypothetical protein